MSVGQDPIVSFATLGFISGLLLLPCVDTTAYFSQFPPSVLYVSSGGTARFVWDYHVDNREQQFTAESPVWLFNDSKIGVDDRFTNNWSFVIKRATCPPRLLNPDRVSRESPATLVITDVTTADNGIYKCRLVLQGNNPIEHQVRMVVTVSPTFLPSYPNKIYQVIEGQDLKINCTAIGPPTPNITWVNITDGNDDTKTQGIGSAVLHISSITRYHAGVYECQAKNNPNENANTTRTSVTVYYSPKITHFSDDVMINEGSLIELKCLASGCPQPNITWSKGSFLHYGDILRILHATRNDTGNYTCTAKNAYVTREHLDKEHIYVTVRYKPSIVHWTKDQIINETNPLHLTCIADGYPAPTITWTKSPGTMTPSVATGNEYSIQAVKRSDAGTYTCTASNEIGSAKKTISVVVQYKPTILKQLSSTNFSSWNGRQVTLKCTVSDGLPMPDITWYNPSGQQITTGVTAIAKGSQVVITTSDVADYGSYKCKATNVAGSDEHVINVTQLFPPGAPNVTLLDQNVQASSVTVKWTKPGYDGGSPVIDYKVQINTTNPLQEQNTANTEHEFTGLTKNTRYEVRVYSRNVVGHGNASIIIFTTKKQGPPPLPSLHLSKSKSTITLYWTKPEENGGTIKSYTIYQKQGVDKTWTRIHILRDLSNLTYVVQLEDLEPGQTYWFIVTATNEFGESEKGSSDKGKEAYVLPKVTTATTKTQTTTTALDGKSKHKSDGQEKCSVTALAVCAAFLAVSLVFIVLLLLYIWRNVKRKEPVGNTIRKRVPRNRTVEDPVYDNTIEMKENQASSNPVSSQHTSPPSEYEPIITSRDDHPVAMSGRVDGYSSISETPSHYQALSHPDTAGSSHQGQCPTYEPIRRPQFKEPDAQLAKNVPDTTYQPLVVRLNPTDYQSLQTYDNMHQLENTRNDQSVI